LSIQFFFVPLHQQTNRRLIMGKVRLSSSSDSHSDYYIGFRNGRESMRNEIINKLKDIK